MNTFLLRYIKKCFPISQASRKSYLVHHMPMPPLRVTFFTEIIVFTNHAIKSRTSYRILFPTSIAKITIVNILVINSNRIQRASHRFSCYWFSILLYLLRRRLWIIRWLLFSHLKIHYKGEKFHNITIFSYLTFTLTGNAKTNLLGIAHWTWEFLQFLRFLMDIRSACYIRRLRFLRKRWVYL